MNQQPKRHGGLMVLRWGIGFVVTVLGLMMISELGQFLVWQLVGQLMGENVQYWDVTLLPGVWHAGSQSSIQLGGGMLASAWVLMEIVQ